MRRAHVGLEELRKHVDTIIVIPNQNLFKIANEQATFKGLSNLQQCFNAWRSEYYWFNGKTWINRIWICWCETVMASMGKAMMGTGEAEGGINKGCRNGY